MMPNRFVRIGPAVERLEMAQTIVRPLGPRRAVTGINLSVDAGFVSGTTRDAHGGPLGDGSVR
jgi:hypothetical protein